MNSPIKLGPFLLLEPLAQGGMAEVWRGIHETEGTPVAVKVITGHFAKDPTYESAFRNEVRSVAGLSHQGIVLVFDYGTIPQETAQASDGKLKEGSVYLVMELASMGCLSSISYRDLKWETVRDTLLCVLSALGHAHARDVIHRDIKPGNILLCGEDDLRPGVKLTDFGIAYPVGTIEGAEGVDFTSGTPGYMAPEQIEGKWREFGPWTDLYALGCVAYEMICWSRPHEADTPLAMAMSHLRNNPAPLINRIVTPTGLPSWIETLMHKEPTQRFQSAAEAAWALLELDSDFKQKAGNPKAPLSDRSLAAHYGDAYPLILTPDEGADTAELELMSYRTTDVSAMTVTHWAETMISPAARASASPSNRSRSDITRHTIRRPHRRTLPMADTWTPPATSQSSLHLLGAGLGLYGLRELPLIGRASEREALWNEFRQVRNEKQTRVVLLSGPTGTGKSKLAKCLLEELSEQGLAHTWKVTHGRARNTPDAIAQLIDQVYACGTEDRIAIQSRLQMSLDTSGHDSAYECHALTEAVMPATEEELAASEHPVVFAGPHEKYALITRMLARESTDLPCAVWIDDAQWGEDTIGLLHHVLTSPTRHSTPILLVVTVQDDSLIDGGPAAQSLKLLRKRFENTGLTDLPIAPLSDAEHQRLVEDLLHLDGDLAKTVQSRTHGNPMFAVRLIEDWVTRGILVVKSAGFALTDGANASIPDNLHAIWKARLDHAMDGRLPDLRHAVEMGAVLGHRFLEREWKSACHQAHIRLSKELLETLLESGLLTRKDKDLMFAHSMLQESLQRDSRDNARWEEYNRAAARMLQTLYPSRRRGLSARIGLHLFEGREADNAIEPLLSGAQDAESAGQISQALHLLSIREECQDIIRCAKDDPSRISGHLLRACVQIQAGEYDQAHDSANAAADSAKRTANPTQRADALGWLAHIHHLRGKYDEALAAYTQKKTLSEHVDYTQGMANALLGIGSIYLARGEYGEARNAYRLAYEQYELIDENKGMGRSVYGMAVAASKEGDLPGSDAFNRRAMKLFEGCGSLDGVALCMNGIAESARFQGDLSSAEQGYRRAASMFEALGSSNEIVMRMNVALVLLGRNRFEEALTELKPIEQHLADQRPNVFLPFVYSQLLASYAHLQLWSLWETSLALFKEVIEEVDALDRDIAYPLQISAEQCVKHGRKDYAKLAYELSLDQWDRIGNLKAKNLVQLALQAIS